MTQPITPPPTPTVPAYPALGSPSFNQQAYDYATAMPGVADAIGDLAQNAAQNAQISHENSVTALQAKDLAVAAAEVAQAASNFLGLWVDLTGPAPRGASVKHNARFWISVVNIPDIAASEPGVSSDWTPIGGGSVIVQRVAVNTTMTPGVLYVVTAPGVTLTAPASLLVGDSLSMSNATAERVFVNFAGHTIKYRAPDAPMSIPALRGFTLVFDGTTLA